MPLAIGGSSAAGASVVGEFWVNVLDFGAKADGGTTDNSVPIQAAIDYLAAEMNGADIKGIVYIPSALKSYAVYKPIYLDASNIEIRGDGWGTSIFMLSRHSVFIAGVSRVATNIVNGVATPLTINASNRPDCFGKLDTSVATAAGQVWGLRTNANAFVQFQANPFAAGVVSVPGYPAYSDNWGTTTQLTVEFCIEPPTGQQFPAGTPILGMSSNSGFASPWSVETTYQANRLLFRWRTSELDPTQVRIFDFDLGTATPPYRVAIQLDLVKAAYSAFVNGVQVAIIDHSSSFPTGLTFATNDSFPFMIGSFGPAPSFAQSTGIDLRVYGLRLSNSIRYQNNGAGTQQVRADTPTTPINDSWAYFGNDKNTIAYLAGTDNPATPGRLVTVAHGGAAAGGPSSGLFVHSVFPKFASGIGFRDLDIECGWSYGAGILLGAVLDVVIEGVRVRNGYYGIGSFNSMANYYVNMSRCRLDGTDAGYYGAFQMLWAREISFISAARATIRHLGCNARWDDVFVERPSPISECIFKANGHDIGGNFLLTNWLIDYEGDTLSRCAFYCEAHLAAPATSLNLQNISVGTIGSTSSIIQLKDTGTQNQPLLNPCWFKADNVSAPSFPYLAVVDVDGPLWHGEVTGTGVNGTRLYHRQKWGTTTGIQTYESSFIAPPRELYWYAGAHVLEVRSPVEGQFTEWRCASTGTYGTAAPPVWAGLTPIQTTQNGLAAYVLNNGYITVTIS